MNVTILSLFPDMIQEAIGHSIIKRAVANGYLNVDVVDIRDFTKDKHKSADDYQYGGGAGMLMKPEPVFEAVDFVEQKCSRQLRLILTSPEGERFDQSRAYDYSRETKQLVIICGHYEGIDERVVSGLAPEEVSIGDFILTGGELAALLILDASARLIPGVLGNSQSLEVETFSGNLLDYPKYTRPAVFRGMKVPEVLLGGNHAEIEKWRREMALLKTKRKRADLLSG